MVNKCTIIITRGKNKGKLCKDANKRCMHCVTPCQFCGQQFGYISSLKRHEETCYKKPEAEVSVDNSYVKEDIEIKDTVSPVDLQVLVSEREQLQQQLAQLDSKLDLIITKTGGKPRFPHNQGHTVIGTQNNYTVNNTINIQVIGSDFYEQLIERIGESCAIDMLAKAAATNKPLDVVKTLFLDGVQPDKYPIAYHAGQYRYLDDKNKVVEDRCGEIAKLTTLRIQQAMLRATNDLIMDKINSGKEDELYEVYDIGSIQTGLTKMGDDENMRNFSKLFDNQHHPLFQTTPEHIVN